MRDAPAYFKWRGGRPRWEPGPSLRARGVRGRDLKDDTGAWLSFDEAKQAAHSINERGRTLQKKWTPRQDRRRLTKVTPIPDYDDLLSEVWAHNRAGKGRATLPNRGSYVYIFTFDGRWAKIGVSKNVRHRYDTLARGVPSELEVMLVAPGSLREERALQDHFAPYQMRGEWFRIAGEFGVWLTSGRP